MSIYFTNPGVIDLNVIRIMGVSVKENDNPIGYFGTGLKFALATLLRTGHKIAIQAGGEHLPITARTEIVRGEEFERVYMGDEALPFTTKLGRNWEVWQAFRELHSNALDEGGMSSDRPVMDDTVIRVDGDGIESAYATRHQIFIPTAAICSAAGVEVHPTPGQYVFYRGVRAGALPEPGAFTYNITKKMDLSEDRNFASLWDVEYAIATALPAMKSRKFASDFLEAKSGWDTKVNLTWCGAPSEEFIEIAASRRNDSTMPVAAKLLLAKHAQNVGSYPACATTAGQEYLIGDAIRLIARLGCDLKRSEVTITDTLGPGVYGLYHKARNEIFIARQTLDNGQNFLAATLFEEWLHKRHRLADASREMQQFLFDRLIALAGEMPCEMETAA